MASTEYHGKYKKLFPGVLSSNSFLSVYILHLLNSHSKMYGKEIADGISRRLNNTWEPSHGLVYPLLRNLEDIGLVRGFWDGTGTKKTKRFYMITDLGRQALRDELTKVKPMFEESRKMIDAAMTDLYAMV